MDETIIQFLLNKERAKLEATGHLTTPFFIRQIIYIWLFSTHSSPET